MTIRSYIDKNLTHLNWNILPQIFESEGVELTEEIERYLRETPKNTNWNVLGQMSNEDGNKRTVIFEGSVTTIKPGQSVPIAQGDINITFSTDLEYIVLIYNNIEYNLPKTIVSSQMILYGESNASGPIWSNYPLQVFINNGTTSLYTENEGIYSIKIEIEE